MRFWTFAGGPQNRLAKQETIHQAATGQDNNQVSNGPESAHNHTIT
jgi:hypothetical protein